MGMLAHTVGRYIRRNGCHSRKVSPRRSIVAGGVLANKMAKVALYFIMEKLHEKMPMCRINTVPANSDRTLAVNAWQYVDAISQRCAGKRGEEVQKAIIYKAIDFVKNVKEQGFVLSDRSAIVAESPAKMPAAPVSCIDVSYRCVA